MIANLFRIFDPRTSKFLILNWIRIIFILIFSPYTFWKIPSRIQIINYLVSKYIIRELINNLSKKNFISLIIFLSIFWFILINNLIGLYPYIFTATSHLIITLSLALPLWTLFIIYGWLNNINHIFSHLVPLGTPIALRFFL